MLVRYGRMCMCVCMYVEYEINLNNQAACPRSCQAHVRRRNKVPSSPQVPNNINFTGCRFHWISSRCHLLRRHHRSLSSPRYCRQFPRPSILQKSLLRRVKLHKSHCCLRLRTHCRRGKCKCPPRVPSLQDRRSFCRRESEGQSEKRESEEQSEEQWEE